MSDYPSYHTIATWHEEAKTTSIAWAIDIIAHVAHKAVDWARANPAPQEPTQLPPTSADPDACPKHDRMEPDCVECCPQLQEPPRASAAESRDEHWPPRGPCALCGHPDARHRIYDAIRERREAGESIASLCRDYDKSPEAIVLALEWECDEPAPPTSADKPTWDVRDDLARYVVATDKRNPSPTPEEP